MIQCHGSVISFLNFTSKKIYLWMFPYGDECSDSESNWSLSVNIKILDVLSVPVTLVPATLDVKNFWKGRNGQRKNYLQTWKLFSKSEVRKVWFLSFVYTVPIFEMYLGRLQKEHCFMKSCGWIVLPIWPNKTKNSNTIP